MYSSLLLLIAAAALSLDGFAAGFALGVQHLRMGWLPRLCLAAFSAVFAAAALLGGALLGGLCSPISARSIGGGLLLLFGGLTFVSAFRPSGTEPPSLLKLPLQVAREPAAGDLDSSGSIEPGEALLLGLALSLDMLGGGLGLSLSEAPPLWLIPAIGILQAALLSLGQALGARFARTAPPKGFCSALSGLLLLGLGALRLLL